MNMVTSKNLRRRIMYRVYMSFVISIAEHRFFWQGFMFGAALALFGRLVHVAAIADNTLATPLRDLPGYLTRSLSQAVTSGEFLTILAILVMLTIGVSFVRAFIRLTLLGRPQSLA
jgi:hypothetical protein